VTQIPLPAQPTVTDPCGPNNATWIKPNDTAEVTWSVDNGVLTATTTTAFEFPGGESSHSYGTAPDSGEACPTNQACTIVAAGDTSTNLHPTWTVGDTRSAGHYEYVDGGLHVWTDDASSNAKVAMKHSASFDLEDTGTVGIDFTLTSGTIKPGVQLYVNFDGTNEGTLVYEGVYGQDLWLTSGSSQVVKDNAPVNGGGNGSQWHGTIDQWLTKFPDAKVTGIGFSLGSGVHADGVLHSITVGCTQYFFDHVTPTPPVVVVPPVTPPGPPAVVPPVTPIPPQVGGVKVTAPPQVEGVKHTAPPAAPVVEGVKYEAAATLPRTGTDAGEYAALGGLLLLMGAALLLVSRRRSTEGRAH
jgi:LPXTG-motif cell wall-anchored protein